MRSKPRIGDVGVFHDGDDMWGFGLIGDERARVLRAFMNGEDTTGYYLAFAPWSGPRYRIESPEGVNWCDMREEVR